MTKTALELRNEAAELDNKMNISFERSDTDGFLSQWALGLSAQERRLEAELIESPAQSFAALFNLEGARVRAKLWSGSLYGGRFPNLYWMFVDANDVPTGKYIAAFPARVSTMEKKGYREGEELAAGKVKVIASGTGLAGAASARVAIVRADEGYPTDAKVNLMSFPDERLRNI